MIGMPSYYTVHNATKSRRCHDGFVETVVLLSNAIHETVVESNPQPSHNGPTALSMTQPRRFHNTTVPRRFSRNRRFIFQNRPRKRRGRLTINLLMTVTRHYPRRNYNASTPRWCHYGFIKTVVLLSKTVHKTLVARQPATLPRRSYDTPTKVSRCFHVNSWKGVFS